MARASGCSESDARGWTPMSARRTGIAAEPANPVPRSEIRSPSPSRLSFSLGICRRKPCPTAPRSSAISARSCSPPARQSPLPASRAVTSGVISAKGLGSDRIETQQPYQEDSEVDRWLYGPPRRQALIRVLDVDPPASAYHARSIQEHAWASKPLFPRTRFSPRSCST